MECPKCHAEISDATYCGCGWKKPKAKAVAEEPELLAECAYTACQTRAKVKIKVTTGWANLCIHHYEEHYRLKALETCKTLGLHTTEQRRAWVKAAVAKLAAKWRPGYLRQPGEDLEESHEAKTL